MQSKGHMSLELLLNLVSNELSGSNESSILDKHFLILLSLIFPFEHGQGITPSFSA
jgi:hypothetical protein